MMRIRRDFRESIIGRLAAPPSQGFRMHAGAHVLAERREIFAQIEHAAQLLHGRMPRPQHRRLRRGKQPAGQ